MAESEAGLASTPPGATNSGSSDQVISEPGAFPISAMLAEYGGLMSIVNAKVEEVVQSCMAVEGFDYLPQPMLAWEGWGNVEPWAPFQSLPIDQAASQGYVLNQGPELEPVNSFQGPPEQQEAFNQALLGSPEETITHESGMTIGTGGCLGTARAEIASGVEASTEWLGFSGYLQRLGWEAYGTAETSDEWREILNDWQECMRQNGYEVVGFDGAMELALVGAQDTSGSPVHEEDGEDGGDPRPTEHEIEVAVTDAECRVEGSLEDQWNGLISVAEQEVVADNPEVVLEWVGIAQTIRTVVSDVLDTVPDPANDPADEYSLPDQS